MESGWKFGELFLSEDKQYGYRKMVVNFIQTYL